MNNVTKSEFRAARMHFRRFLQELKKDILTILRFYAFRASVFAKGDDRELRENNAIQKAMDVLQERNNRESLLKTPISFDTDIEYMEHENPIIAACMNNQPIRKNR